MKHQIAPVPANQTVLARECYSGVRQNFRVQPESGRYAEAGSSLCHFLLLQSNAILRTKNIL